MISCRNWKSDKNTNKIISNNEDDFMWILFLQILFWQWGIIVTPLIWLFLQFWLTGRTQVSSKVMIRLRNARLHVHSVLSAISVFPLSAMFSSLRLCGPHQAQIFPIFNFFLSMWRNLSGVIPTFLASSIQVQQWCSSSITACTCTSSLADWGLPAPHFLLTSSLPLRNAYADNLHVMLYGIDEHSCLLQSEF